MPNHPKKKTTKIDPDIKKIKKLYENYGINTTDMSEEEFERLVQQYRAQGKSLEKDLKESEKYSSIFGDEDIIG